MGRLPERLVPIYDIIGHYHMTTCPDLRIGQLFSNFEVWLEKEVGIDIYYLEDYRFLEYLEKYLDSITYIKKNKD